MRLTKATPLNDSYRDSVADTTVGAVAFNTMSCISKRSYQLREARGKDFCVCDHRADWMNRRDG